MDFNSICGMVHGSTPIEVVTLFAVDAFDFGANRKCVKIRRQFAAIGTPLQSFC